MDEHAWEAVECRTREWLDRTFRGGIRDIHERRPAVFDARGAPCRLTAYAFQALQRKLQIFRLLDRLDFSTFVDVGAGWESYPQLVRQRYGAAAFYADFNHAANLPLGGFPSDRLDCAVTANVARLPFSDGAFDVVLCSEVLEHLVRPVEAMAELLRVARKAVIVTSLEALAHGRWRRLWLHYRTDVSVPHVERNFFTMREIRLLFGEACHYESLFDSATLPAALLAPEHEQRRAYGAIRDAGSLIRALCAATSGLTTFGPGTVGILVLKRLDDSAAGTGPDRAADDLAAWLVGQAAAIEREQLAVLDRYRNAVEAARRDAPELADDAVLARVLARLAPDRRRPVAEDLLRRLCCPDCHGSLRPAPDGLQCSACASDFRADYGVPLLDPRRMPEGCAVEGECVEGLCEGDSRRRRALRRLRRRLRRNERPPGRVRRRIWTLADRYLSR